MLLRADRSILRCGNHVQLAWLFLGVFSLFAASAQGDSFGLDAYNQWQANGARRTSSLPVDSSASSLGIASYIASPQSDTSQVTSLTPASTSSGTSTLSGYVYVDTIPSDSAMGSADWAIAGAKVELIPKNGTPIITATQADGLYTFADLGPSTYSIKILTPSTMPGTDSLGQLNDANQQLVAPGQLDVASRTFENINILTDGYNGANYDFADLAYPVGLVTKRMFLNSSDAIQPAVPEPGTLMLLAMAGLTLSWPLSRRVLGRLS